VRRKSILALVLALLPLTACDGEPQVLPEPKLSVYLLDLTGSGDAVAQFGRVKDDLLNSMTDGTFGNPFEELGEVTGPTITRMYFVGTNSFALEDFKLQDEKLPAELSNYVIANNNQTRRVKFWRLLMDEYTIFIKRALNAESAPSKAECMSYFDAKLNEVWSSESVRQKYSNDLCDMATYSLTNYFAMENYINSQSLPGAQKASDVFGALAKIDTTVKKFHSIYPTAKVNIVLATDGDHTVGRGNEKNLRTRLSEAANPCALSNEIKTEYSIQQLEPSDWLSVDVRGIAALIRGSGDYPRLLNDFWQRCFFPQE
jgi:hypothetical protein